MLTVLKEIIFFVVNWDVLLVKISRAEIACC